MEIKMNISNNSSDRQNVSFKFTKKVSKTLTGNKLDEDNSAKAAKDYVISVDKSEIKSTAPREKEKDLVIPLIKKNNWRIPNAAASETTDSESKLKEMAVEELLKESMAKNEQWENREFKNVTVAIPLIMQNKIPEGYETDDKMDVSLRPDESKLEDYERIPIEKFGLAVLKGMGWKEGDPIGANAMKAVEPIQVQLRPKGLGLGADASALNKVKEKKENGEKLELIKGAYIRVTQGSKKGFYGQVLGLDEENARVIVKISGNDKIITFPEFSLELVSKKEFDKESKVINRAAYEKYQNGYEENKKFEDKSKEKVRRDRENSKEKKNSKEDRKRSHEFASSKEHNSERREGHSKKRRSAERSSEGHSKSSDKSCKTWVRPQLKVRLIDDHYKKGKYFNEKLIVEDVISSKNCTCKTENGKYLDAISPSMLETVIPRTERGYVMIVQGKYSGELCTVLEKDKSRCLATIQFLSNRDKALQIEYDSICEYVGDVAEFD